MQAKELHTSPSSFNSSLAVPQNLSETQALLKLFGPQVSSPFNPPVWFTSRPFADIDSLSVISPPFAKTGSARPKGAPSVSVRKHHHGYFMSLTGATAHSIRPELMVEGNS
jgi:hypothetical protein